MPAIDPEAAFWQAHDEPPVGQVTAAPRIDCDSCHGRHDATYSHDGRFGEGPIFAVTCPVDGLADFYTAERIVAP